MIALYKNLLTQNSDEPAGRRASDVRIGSESFNANRRNQCLSRRRQCGGDRGWQAGGGCGRGAVHAHQARGRLSGRSVALRGESGGRVAARYRHDRGGARSVGANHAQGVARAEDAVARARPAERAVALCVDRCGGGARSGSGRERDAGRTRRASSRAPGEFVPGFAVRRGGAVFDRRVGRFRQRDVGRRPRRHDLADGRGDVSAFARNVLHGAHAVPRISEIRRRVQGDGAGVVRRARSRSRSSARS